MRWRHPRRALTILGLILALVITFWPQLTRPAHADQSISLNPPSGPPGTQVTVTVNNLTSALNVNDPVSVIYYPPCGDIPPPFTFNVTQTNVLPAMSFTVPPSADCPSSYSAQVFVILPTVTLPSAFFQVTGNSGGGTATATATGPTATGTPPTGSATPFTTQFVLTPSTAALNQPIAFSAGGFSVNEQVSLSILVNGRTVPLNTATGSLIADATGRVSGTFILPPSTQTIIANSTGGNAGYTAQVTVVGANPLSKQQATLTVPPTTVNAGANAIIPGNTITITGGGFSSGEGVTLVLINNSNSAVTTLGAVTAGVDGTISTTATAPSANGTYTLKATGLVSSMVAVQQLTIGTPIGITISPVIALNNQSVTVSGFGFSHSAQVTIGNLDGGPIVVNTDATGAFTITTTVPAAAVPGSVISVRAMDNNGLSASAPLTVDNGQAATISVTPTSASPGQILTVSGTNYAAGENVSLELASNSAPPVPITSTVKMVMVDNTRAFSTTLTVPALTDGLYLLLATGQSSNRTAATSITVANGLPGATATPTGNPGYVPFPTVNVPTAAPTVTPTVSALTTQTTYFAEGFTGQARTNGKATFKESLNLFNTRAVPGVATVTYYVLNANGTTTQTSKQVSLAALSATSLSVNGDVGNDKEVSIAVTHSIGVVAQMALARTGPTGAALDAAASSGSNQAATTWNFAEGYTGEEFQEYLSVFNPNAAAARVQVRFLPTSGTPPTPLSYTVGPNGRQSINVRSAYLGLAGPHAPKSVAIVVSANQKIVVDRVLYWGAGSGSGKFGYEVAPGIPAGAAVFSFPGLVVGAGNEPYITVLNPSSGRASFQIVFRDATGRTLASYTTGILPLARLTLSVRTVLHAFSGVVSAVITASAPLVAEAPIYFGGSPNVGSHPGVAELGRGGGTSAAAAGYAAGAGLYVFNPGPTAIQVTRQIGGPRGLAGSASFTVPALGLATSTLPGVAGAHGLLVTGSGPFTAAVINGSLAAQSVWGGTLITP